MAQITKVIHFASWYFLGTIEIIFLCVTEMRSTARFVNS